MKRRSAIHRSIQARKGPWAFSWPLKGAVLFLSLVLSLLNGSAQDPPALDTVVEEGPLEEHLKKAAEANPALLASFREYHRALQKVPQVKSLPDPELSFGYFISPVETRVGPQRATFSLKQMFPWKGTLDSRGEAAALRAKAKYEAFQAERAELFRKVRDAWYELYLQEADIASVKETLESLRTMEGVSESRYRSGRRSMVDHLRIRVQRRQMEERLRTLQEGMEPLRTRFNALIDEGPDEDLQMPDTLRDRQLPISEEAALRDSVRARDPQTRKLRILADASVQDRKTAEKEGRPSVGVGLNYTVVGERSDMDVEDNGKDVFMPMISVRLPIYREKYKAMEQEADFARERYEDLEDERSRQLERILDESFFTYEDAGRRIQLYEEQVRDIRQARSILLESFRTGEADVDELLELERLLYEYRFELERGRVNRNKAVARFRELLNE